MVTLSVAVAHAPWDPWRRANLLSIHRALGGIRGVRRDATDFEIVTDYDRSGCWATERRALMAGIGSGTHHLLLEDDVELCRDFLPGVKKLIAANHEVPIALFSVEPEVAYAAESGRCWLKTPAGAVSIAMVLPSWMIRPLLDWQERYFADASPHTDIRISLFCLERGIPVWVTAPCLVEHAGAKKSLMNHNRSAWRAGRFIGDLSPLEIDWAAGVADPYYANINRRWAIAKFRRKGFFREEPTWPRARRWGAP